MTKYWATKGQLEYMVITESFDTIAGNFYETVKGGFKTDAEAQKHADKLNKEYELESDIEDALGYHDPKERMEELGYIFVDKKWVKKD